MLICYIFIIIQLKIFHNLYYYFSHGLFRTVVLFPVFEFSLLILGFSGGSDDKESACNVGDLGLIPESG